MNAIFQEYKAGVIEIRNGQVIQQDLIDFDIKEDYLSIPLVKDNEKYNRAKVKREMQNYIQEYVDR